MTHLLPAGAEARLLLDCARVALAPGDRARIASALEHALDWPLLLRLARRHGLVPLLHRHLEAVGAERVPRDVRVQLWGEADGIARRNAALAAELARLVRLLESAGVRVVPYKGPTLALAAYGELALREFGDLDLLLARCDVMRALGLLRAAGYDPDHALGPDGESGVLASSAQYHFALRARGEGARVEVHWKSDPFLPVERLDDPFYWGQMESITVAGEGVRALPREDLFLILLLHGARHRWSSLGWLVDIAELLRRRPLDWARIQARASRLRCVGRAAIGLHLAAGLLGAPMPVLASALVGGDGAPESARALVATLFEEPAGELQGFAALRADLALYDNAALRIRHAMAVACAPSLVEWSRWPLPRSLFFLYPGLRVGRLAAKHLRHGVSALFRPRRLHP